MINTTVASKRPTLLDAINIVIDQIDGVVVVLASLTFAGVLAGLWRLVSGLGASTHLTDGIPWGVWIGFDFTLIAFSGAGFTMAAVVYILRLDRFRPALRPAVLTAFLGYSSVLVLLVLDLGRPDRFYHFLLYWNLHSPLFEISWCVLLYTTVLTLEVLPIIFDAFNKPGVGKWVHRIILVLAVAAVTLSSLHQSTLGTLYLNMPYRLHALWFTPLLPVLFFVSSVAVGLSMAIVGYRVATRITGRRAKMNVGGGLAKGVMGAAALYLVVRLGSLLLTGKAALLLSFDGMSRLVWLELLLMAIAPIILFASPRTRNSARGQYAGSLLVMAGTLLNRFDATLFGEIAPAGSVYSPHIVEWLTTIGVVAGAALVWYLGVKFLAVFEKAGAHH